MTTRAALSHLDAEGRARMVDVGDKTVTTRTATASGRFITTEAVMDLVRADGMPKADVLATARIAAIQGAKRTSELIPLCHPIPLNSVKVEFTLEAAAIVVTATAKTTGKTGVEMEALTAVSVAGLTLHDMVKAVDPRAVMTDIQLDDKTGGKAGHWTRAGVIASTSVDITAARVLVVSTRGAAGTRDDTTGPLIAAWLDEHGFSSALDVVADAEVARGLRAALEAAPALLITTGGTGVSPSDLTPEATGALIDRAMPGIAEAIRAKGLENTPMAALSRGLVGFVGPTLVVNLPGSPGGVKDGLSVLDALLPHVLAQAAGGGNHE